MHGPPAPPTRRSGPRAAARFAGRVAARFTARVAAQLDFTT